MNMTNNMELVIFEATLFSKLKVIEYIIMLTLYLIIWIVIDSVNKYTSLQDNTRRILYEINDKFDIFNSTDINDLNIENIMSALEFSEEYDSDSDIDSEESDSDIEEREIKSDSDYDIIMM